MSTFDLIGLKIYGTGIPHRQFCLFDKTDFGRGLPSSPAVVCRENGEKASGKIDVASQYNVLKKPEFTFTAEDTGKMYIVPLRCCTVTWAGDIAVIAISESELMRRTWLWGIFASCHLF